MEAKEIMDLVARIDNTENEKEVEDIMKYLNEQRDRLFNNEYYLLKQYILSRWAMFRANGNI